jgi:hypothetical protein
MVSNFRGGEITKVYYFPDTLVRDGVTYYKANSSLVEQPNEEEYAYFNDKDIADGNSMTIPDYYYLYNCVTNTLTEKSFSM